MDPSLAAIFTFYVFTTGRRLFALQAVHKEAKDMHFTALEASTALAIKHDRKTRKLEHEWSGVAGSPSGDNQPHVQQVDAQVDLTLAAIRDTALAQASGAEPDDEVVAKVDAFLAAILPAGLAAVTTLPYVEELAAVDLIVKKLKGPLAPVVTELGLSRLVKRLGKLAGEYRDAQAPAAPKAVDFGQVRAARAEGQELMLQCVAIIVGRYHGSSDADVAARSRLLAPILRQNEAMRQAHKARRTPDDVDPKTGKVVSESGKEPGEGAPGQQPAADQPAAPANGAP